MRFKNIGLICNVLMVEFDRSCGLFYTIDYLQRTYFGNGTVLSITSISVLEIVSSTQMLLGKYELCTCACNICRVQIGGPTLAWALSLSLSHDWSPSEA